MSLKNLCVFGLGYIGLPTACLFATNGHPVIGVDINKEAVRLISQGKPPLEEPGLAELLQNALRTNNLVTNKKPEDANVFLIAVPTPLDKRTKRADLRYVREAGETISDYLKLGDLVILESTAPPGTSEKLLLPILEKSGFKGGRDFFLVHCPERAIPGNAIYEIVHNDRVIGGINKESAELAKELYSCFVKGNFYLTNLRTAEMVKLMENTFRDINIALANEFAQIAEESGVNIWEAIELANKHPRVNILKPGPGVGGHCLAVDPWFLAENSNTSRIILLAREINDSMPHHVLGLVKELLEGVKDATVTILGIAYKGNIDDVRETPALELIRLAENEGYRVKIYDPLVRKFEYEILDLEPAVTDSDCIVLVTDHSEFKKIDPEEMSPLVRNKNLVDTRKILDHQRWKKAGFRIKLLGDGASQVD